MYRTQQRRGGGERERGASARDKRVLFFLNKRDDSANSSIVFMCVFFGRATELVSWPLTSILVGCCLQNFAYSLNEIQA